MVGLENHLNYIRGVSRELDEKLAYGLSALLNSTFLDRYFRISNGNTQVSATELRAMPLPAERDIRSIGAEVQARLDTGAELPGLDALIAETLNLSPELRMGLEQITGLSSRLERARDLVREGRIQAIPDLEGAYRVINQDGQSHVVQPDGRCNCADYEYRYEFHKGWCKHRIATKLLESGSAVPDRDYEDSGVVF